jgi:GNAT superfamily N-acetyltransferase
LATAYCVVKVPAGEGVLVQAVQAADYRFVEAMCTVDSEIVGAFDVDADYKCPLSVSPADVDRVLREIGAQMFSSDRIALDPNFGLQVAARRYQNWVADIVEAGGEVCEVVFEGDAVGFFTLRGDGRGVLHGELNGLYASGRGRGLGREMHRAVLAHAQGRDADRYTSKVSSNNVAGLRAVVAAGLVVTDVHYIFTRHL